MKPEDIKWSEPDAHAVVRGRVASKWASIVRIREPQWGFRWKVWGYGGPQLVGKGVDSTLEEAKISAGRVMLGLKDSEVEIDVELVSGEGQLWIGAEGGRPLELTDAQAKAIEGLATVLDLATGPKGTGVGEPSERDRNPDGTFAGMPEERFLEYFVAAEEHDLTTSGVRILMERDGYHMTNASISCRASRLRARGFELGYLRWD